jgi:hypothetical protein
MRNVQKERKREREREEGREAEGWYVSPNGCQEFDSFLSS